MTVPTPEFRLVPPPADGLAGAFREAAARRRRKAATTGSAGVLGAAIVFATLTGGTGQVLTQDPLPPAQQDRNVLELLPVEPAPSAPARTQPESPTRAVGPAPAGDAGRTGATAAPGGPAAAATRAAAPRAAAPRAAAPRYRPGPMTRTSSTAGLGCATVVGLCSSVYQVTGTEPRLAVDLCNTSADTARFDFTRRDEVDITVTRDSTTLWRWSTGRPRVSDPHQVPLRSGDCLTWTTPYAEVDQSGAALPPGTYTLTSVIDSPDADNIATATTTFTVD